MSKVRENVPIQTGELESAPTGDLQHYEIFIQLERGKPHMHAGSLEAVDEEMALCFARDHYGRDQPCVQVWVVPRTAISCLDAEKEVIWRLTDQSYRQAKGYAGVRKKWEQFRKSGDVDRYQTEDLKEGF